MQIELKAVTPGYKLYNSKGKILLYSEENAEGYPIGFDTYEEAHAFMKNIPLKS